MISKEERSTIENIIINKENRRAIKDITVMIGPAVDSNHYLEERENKRIKKT